MKEKQSIKDLQPYVVNPIKCTVKLDANEGSKSLFKELIKDMEDNLYLNLYPDDTYKDLKEAISNYVGCSIENISVGNGSSELLDLCIKTFVDTNQLILSLNPTFSMYSIYAKVFNTKYMEAKVEDDFTINADKVIESIKEYNPKLTIICNPNNPTGTIISRDDVLKIVKSTDEIVIVDEAYMEFSNESVIDQIENYDNLIVVRTFSKAFSMAGIRTGYLVANKELVKTIEKVRAPYNLNSISALLATKALKQKEKMIEYANQVKVERDKMYQELKNMGIKAYKSGANFIFFYSDIDKLEYKLIKDNILIRKFSGKLENYYRVSIGTYEENKAFINSLKKFV